MKYIYKNGARKFNGAITRRVIALQAKGYGVDFFMIGRQMICTQSNCEFPVDVLDIRVVDQAYDRLNKCYKYIHTVESADGEKGLFIGETIVTNVWTC
ncbi:hypothetical protein [Mucilaginibacter antarcticus]|uniref:Uncharacterized protein n=1 Tax=Mucilaginibacter antarcticus TaxID=1855725 RepID=A0ABW5XUT4_9SPHI